MKTVCPSCGAIHSADALFQDAEARQCMKVMSELPAGVGRSVLGYLALFRPGSGKVLQWRKALRLLSELKDLVGAPHIQRGQNVARPNRSEFWRDGLERIVSNPPGRLPLKSHGYLHSIVYDVANDADRKTEVSRNKDERKGNVEQDQSGPAMSMERMKEISSNRFKKKGTK